MKDDIEDVSYVGFYQWVGRDLFNSFSCLQSDGQKRSVGITDSRCRLILLQSTKLRPKGYTEIIRYFWWRCGAIGWPFQNSACVNFVRFDNWREG